MIRPRPIGDLRAVRQANRQAVLYVLRQHGPCSRARLARLTGLSPPTVSSVVEDLLAKGLVVEDGTGTSSGGRPPILLRFNSRAGSILGVELQQHEAVGILSDLEGQVLARARVAFDPADLSGTLSTLLERLLPAQPSIPLRGAGIAVPGIVDPETGTVRFANRLGWRDEPVAERLARALDVPVRLENDVNAMLLAECRWGAGLRHRHAVLLHVGEGIGAGILVDGRLYTGWRGGAGEVGYMALGSGTSHPRRVDRGSFEFRYSLRALCERAGVRDAVQLVERASGEDPRAAGVLADAERMLAAGIANLAAVLDPAVVICHGPLFRAGGPALLGRLAAALRHLVPRRPELVVDRLGDDAACLGAIARALDGIGLTAVASGDG